MLRLVAVLLLTSLGMSQDTTHQQGVEKRGDRRRLGVLREHWMRVTHPVEILVA